MRLIITPQDGTLSPGSEEGDIVLYESSLDLDGEPLLSVRTYGRGIRLTRSQTTDLVAWLDDWLEEGEVLS